jgi:hypothetical protein
MIDDSVEPESLTPGSGKGGNVDLLGMEDHMKDMRTLDVQDPFVREMPPQIKSKKSNLLDGLYEERSETHNLA